MAIKVERNVRLIYKYNKEIGELLGEKSITEYGSNFADANKEFFERTSRFLMQKNSAINGITSNSTISELIAPDLVGISSNHADIREAFEKHVKKMMISVSVTIGLHIDASYTIDFSDIKRRKHFEELERKGLLKIKEGTLERANEDIEKDVATLIDTGKIQNLDIPMYAAPTNLNDYMIYWYASLSNEVSTLDKFTKSTKINFIMIDSVSQKRAETARKSLALTASEKFVTFVSEATRVDNYLFAFKHEVLSTVENWKDLGIQDKKMLIHEDATQKPDTFLKNIENKMMEKQAEIYQLLMYNIIQVDSNGIFTDSTDPSTPIGGSVTEVMTFLGNPINKGVASQMRAKLGSMTNKSVKEEKEQKESKEAAK